VQTTLRHRRLHLAPLLHRERAVVQRDRQVVVVDAPQSLEDDLGLGAGVDEHQRGAGPPDRLVQRRYGVGRVVAGPRQAVRRQEHGDVGLGSRRAQDQSRPALTHGQIVEQSLRLLHRGREPDEARARRKARQARQPERQQLAAFGPGERVQLIHHHAGQALEHLRRLWIGDQERKRFRRGQQDVRGRGALARPAIRRGVAGPDLAPDRQRHFGDRRRKIAPDVGGERLEGRDVERMEAAPAALPVQVDQARQKAGERLAAAGRRDQQRRIAGRRDPQHLELMGVRPPAAALEPAGEPFRQRLARHPGRREVPHLHFGVWLLPGIGHVEHIERCGAAA
jgi:hypothetical protein